MEISSLSEPRAHSTISFSSHDNGELTHLLVTLHRRRCRRSDSGVYFAVRLGRNSCGSGEKMTNDFPGTEEVNRGRNSESNPTNLK